MEELIKQVYQALEAVVPDIYPNVIPDDQTPPCAVYEVVDSEEENFVDGGKLIERVEIEVEFFSPDYGQTVTKRREIQAAMRSLNAFMEQITDKSHYYSDDKIHSWVQSFTFRTNLV